MNEEHGKLMFGTALNQIRMSRNLSLRKFASIIEFTPAYISDLEKGNRLPTLEVLSRVSQKIILSEEEKKLLNEGYRFAHPSIFIPIDVMYYILENDLVDSIKKLEKLDKKGTKIKKLVSILNSDLKLIQ